MPLKKISACCLALVLFLLLAARLAADMNSICRFKKVAIPVDLRIGDAVLAKGDYDLEFLRANPLSYYLRIMKKGKILHLVQGEEFLYDSSSTIPRKPTLKMLKNKAEKALVIVFESGTDTTIYERVRARYRIAYEGD
jgi:hypothetical protein